MFTLLQIMLDDDVVVETVCRVVEVETEFVVNVTVSDDEHAAQQ